MREYIAKCLKEMEDVYKLAPKRVRNEYNRERELDRAYHGRELLELIQNADDEMIDQMSREVNISFDGDMLSIANNGNPFTREGIDSLMYSNLSPKAQKHMVIGNKGTGFRAILGWASQIIIHSGELHISFSDEHAQDEIRRILPESELKNGLKAATLVFPQWINETYSSEYTTEIRIRIKEDEEVRSDIRKQFENINGDLLLFLNRTESLVINLEDHKICYIKKKQKGNKVEIEKYVDDVLEDSTIWVLNKRDAKYEESNYSVVIAYKADGTLPENQVIYSYFPTDIDFPFPVLLHGNFDLKPDRDHLIKNSKANRQILETAATLLVETAVAATNGKASYKPLKLLIETGNLTKELVDYGFEETMLEQIKKCKILPTVNYKYISFEDDPVFYESELAKVLSGKDFSQLLQYSDDPSIVAFLRKVGYSEYIREYLVEKIDKWAKGRTFDQATLNLFTECIVGFISAYGVANAKTDNPSLIFDSDEKRVSKNSLVFLREEESNMTSPPAFANIRFMHPKMKSALEEKLSLKGRSLAEKLRSMGVREYNTSQIIDKLNSSIRTNIAKGHVERANRYASECILWIWKNREIVSGINDSLKIYLPTRESGLRLSDELFFGKEYGNTIAERLYSWDEEDRFVAAIDTIIENEDSLVIRDFLSMLKVSNFPRIKISSFAQFEEAYWDIVVNNLTYPIYLWGEKISESREFKNYDRTWKYFYMRGQYLYIEDLQSILENCSTDVILDWIYEDRNLYQILQSKRDMSGKTEVIWRGKREYRPIPQQNVYPYISWMFETIPWINVNGERYSIRNTILAPISDILAPDYIEPDIEEYVKDREYSKRLKDRYEAILEDIHVCSGFEDLTDEQLYELLMILPEKDPSGEISKRLYMSILKDERIVEEDSGNPQRERFLDEGRVFCKHKHGYQPINETFYMDEKEVCDKIASQFHLIDIPGHQSTLRIERIFGVKKLKLNGSIVGKPMLHSLNDYFQTEFHKFKPLAFCYRMDTATKDETKRFSDMSITLCSQLKAKYNDAVVELDNYEYISTNNRTYFLKVPAVIDTVNELHNVKMAAAVASVLGAFFGSTKQFQQYRELYQNRNEQARRELIIQVYEDEGIFDRASKALFMYKDTEEEFIDVIEKITDLTKKEIEVLAENIDYSNLMYAYNMQYIIAMFRAIGIDIETYNSVANSSSISLVSYYQDAIINLKRKYEKAYRQTIFEKYLKLGLEEKKHFCKELMDYDSLRISIDDSVWFDCEKELVKQLGIDTSLEIVDLDTLYNVNLNKWLETLEQEKDLEEFLTNSENISLVYFGEYEELNTRYQQLIGVSEEDETQSRYIPEYQPEMYLITTTIKDEPTPKKSTKRNVTPGFHKSKKEKENTQIGRDGERYVYERLKETYDIVDWMSENGKAAGVNPQGSAGNGYDIRYVDKTGRTKYVEVKSSASSEVAFYLSGYEYDFAIRHIDDYELFYVRNLSKRNSKPEILILNDLFKDNEINDKRFNIEIDRTYAISANIQQITAVTSNNE